MGTVNFNTASCRGQVPPPNTPSGNVSPTDANTFAQGTIPSATSTYAAKQSNPATKQGNAFDRVKNSLTNACERHPFRVSLLDNRVGSELRRLLRNEGLGMKHFTACYNYHNQPGNLFSLMETDEKTYMNKLLKSALDELSKYPPDTELPQSVIDKVRAYYPGA
jgi:hypothetical protein